MRRPTFFLFSVVFQLVQMKWWLLSSLLACTTTDVVLYNVPYTLLIFFLAYRLDSNSYEHTLQIIFLYFLNSCAPWYPALFTKSNTLVLYIVATKNVPAQCVRLTCPILQSRV